MGIPDWDEVEATLEWESNALQELQTISDPEELLDAVSAKDDERWDYPIEFFFDMGVTSVAVAIAASGCIPFTSCNGGCFGDHHHEDYPLVGFYCRKSVLPIMISAAKEAAVGLEHSTCGAIVAYSNNIMNMLAFAKSILEKRTMFATQGKIEPSSE